MTEPRRDDSDRITALSLLATFRRQLLPGVLRRVAAWKGIPPRLLAQLAEDVVQDLSVDCLEHAGELVRLDRRSRNARWMQRAERALYRLRRYEQRCRPLVDEPFEVAEQHDAPDIGLPTLVSLDNGRANVAESARRQGLARRALRMQLDEAATRLGWNNERRAFWQARAAEALTGLAADQLRLHAGLFTVDPGPPPDLERRRARLHRLARRFPVQPSTLAVRSALQPWRRRRGCPEPPPRALLQRAVELAPDRAAGWLWLFEACCADGDLAGAARAARAAGRCRDADRAAVVLARARLLELRGQRERALAQLLRSAGRRAPDRRLQTALELAFATG